MRAVTDQHVKTVLGRVDWNFPSATTLPTSVHSLHWFPGNFIPQIPSFLVQALSSAGDLVADPFCGSGTTGVEAALIKRRAWISDRNSISKLISRAKIILLTNSIVRSTFASTAQELLWGLFNADGEQFEERPNSCALDWYHPDTLAQLSAIWGSIQTVQDPDCKTVLEALFSDLLFSCASAGRPTTSGGGKRRHHWGWIADNVRPKQLVWHDARRLFANGVDRVVEAIQASSVVPADSIHFEATDARELPLPDRSVDLVVTSPPYLAMIDYANANRLTYDWFGFDMEEDRRGEIGPRCRRNNLGESSRYLRDMELSAREIAWILKPQSFCAIVIGASRKFPEMATRVIDLFAEKMKPVFGPVERVPKRRRVSGRSTGEPFEFVCVFRNTQ